MLRLLLPLSSLLALSTAHAVEPVETDLRPFSPEAFEGRESGADARLLPEGASGWLPEADGQSFGIEVEAGLFPIASERDLRRALAEILPATGFEGDVDALEIGSEPLQHRAMDAELVAEEAEEGRAEIEETLLRRFGALGEATEMALDLQTREDTEIALRGETHYRFGQAVEGNRVEGLSVTAVVDDGGELLRVTGALTDVDWLSNRPGIEAERATALAEEYLRVYTEVVSVDEPVQTALPTAEGLIAVWRVDVETKQGSWRLRIDAETGDVIGLEQRSLPVDARGQNVLPDPTGSFTQVWFEVNPAVSNKYTLTLDDVLTVTPAGADGCGTTPVSVSAGGAFADFDVAPINGTTILSANQAGYNCRFQEVNVYGRISEALWWFDALGAETVPHLSAKANDDDPCGFGINNACSSGSALAFGIGEGTASGSMVFKDLWNTGLDETVIVHELGHTLFWSQSTQGSMGNLDSSLNEGVADYWGAVLVGTDTVGAWAGQNRLVPQDDGRMPRQLVATDIYPEHILLNGYNNEPHANGEMIALALLNTRQEWGDRSPIGKGLANRVVLSAMATAGVGVNTNGYSKLVYLAFQDMLNQELLAVGNTLARVDMLQGFARAGIFTSAQEAVIDISDDYLSVSDSAPTFTVWTGEDWEWWYNTPSETAVSYNPYYEVELANDEGFTLNLVKSGTLSNIAEDLNGNSVGTWTPSEKEWDTLKAGSVLYYRVTSWGEGGVNQRSSESTKAGALSVPTARAVFNDGGSAGCSAAPGRGSLVGLLAGLAALLARRRR